MLELEVKSDLLSQAFARSLHAPDLVQLYSCAVLAMSGKLPRGSEPAMMSLTKEDETSRSEAPSW